MTPSTAISAAQAVGSLTIGQPRNEVGGGWVGAMGLVLDTLEPSMWTTSAAPDTSAFGDPPILTDDRWPAVVEAAFCRVDPAVVHRRCGAAPLPLQCARTGGLTVTFTTIPLLMVMTFATYRSGSR